MLAQKAVDLEPEDQRYLTGLAAIQMRAGQYQESLTNLEKAAHSLKSDTTTEGYLYYFRAMTEQHLNRPDDARKSLAKANELAEKDLSNEAKPPAWNRKLTLELFRKEAEALIGKPPSENERGSEQPAVAVPNSDRQNRKP